jgi:UTP:GlnB (protein PII) uridylyltransferase
MTTSDFRLRENARGTLALLEVTHPVRRSTLELLRGVLFELGVQIVRVESTVKEQALRERFYLQETDGAPLTRARSRAVRSAVRKALRSGSQAAA